MSAITVYKLDFAGRVTWQYRGHILRQEVNSTVIEAFFDREDVPFQGITLKQGDRFIESYFSDRWYNIFEIYDREDGHLKGYYCNIGRPAVLGDESISYVDLALDLWVTPDGRQTVLDEDEFISLDLDQSTREQAIAALESLQRHFRASVSPM